MGIDAATGVASRPVLGMRVDATASCKDAAGRIVRWARDGRSAYVCAANVHMAMEAVDSEAFRRTVNGADLIVPDGRPLVWALGLLGVRGAAQVRGADLLSAVAGACAEEGVPVGFYGGSPRTLAGLVRALEARVPGLRISCAISPPFRRLSEEEDEAFVREISASGARVLFVGLGCPKQERWMEEHRGRVPAVMIGVGAAFDFHAGTVRQAPRVLQAAGLEWAYRLLQEPRRLLGRYLRHNPRFVAMLAAQALARGARGDSHTSLHEEKGSSHA